MASLLKKWLGCKTLEQTILENKWSSIYDKAREGINNSLIANHHYKLLIDDINTLGKSDLKEKFFALKWSTFKSLNNPYDSCLRLIENCNDNNINVVFDAEEYKYRKYENDIIKMSYKMGIPVYKTIQCYFKNADTQLLKDLDEGITRFKLVRGAYLLKEPSSNVFINKVDTDNMYNNIIKLCAHKENIDMLYATHNIESIKLIRDLYKDKDKSTFYLAHLKGFIDNISSSLLIRGYNVLKYVPYGTLSDSLPFLYRRLQDLIILNTRTNSTNKS